MKTSKLNFHQKVFYSNQVIIFHVDMDAFFASCIELREPNLVNQPLVIANSNLRSIVCTSNYAARKWGIKTGMPVYKAKKLCPNLKIRNPDFEYFSKISQSVWKILNQFSSRLETFSIDEAYLDVSRLWQRYESPIALAQIIQNKIYQKLGLNCSIGVASNKFLAKMASKLDKPHGITTLFENELATKLWPMPLENMWGMGPSTASFLKNNYHFTTIGDFANFDGFEKGEKFSKAIAKLHQNAKGQSNSKVNPYLQLPKSVGNEITLDWPINEWEAIHEVIWLLTKNALIRLKQWKMLAKTVQVSFRYQWKGNENFNRQKHHQRHIKQISLLKPTDDLETLFVNVKDIFNEIYKSGKFLILISVSLKNLVQDNNFYQPTFADFRKPIEHTELNQMVSDLNHKFCKPVAFLGTAIIKNELTPHQNFADQTTHNEIREITHQKK